MCRWIINVAIIVAKQTVCISAVETQGCSSAWWIVIAMESCHISKEQYPKAPQSFYLIDLNSNTWKQPFTCRMLCNYWQCNKAFPTQLKTKRLIHIDAWGDVSNLNQGTQYFNCNWPWAEWTTQTRITDLCLLRKSTDTTLKSCIKNLTQVNICKYHQRRSKVLNAEK